MASVEEDSLTLIAQLKVVPSFSALEFGFDPEQLYAIREATAVYARVKDWLEAGGESAGLGYVTALGEEDELDGQPLTPGLPGGYSPSNSTKQTGKSHSRWAREGYVYRKETHRGNASKHASRAGSGKLGPFHADPEPCHSTPEFGLHSQACQCLVEDPCIQPPCLPAVG